MPVVNDCDILFFMTKEEAIVKIKSLNLQRGSYIVYGSAPLAILGIREVNDIDLLVSPELYEELRNKGWKKICKGPADEPVVLEIFEAHPNWNFSPYAPTLSELLTRATEYKGVSFASLEDVRKWKAASGRPKDIVDLKLIDYYLAS